MSSNPFQSGHGHNFPNTGANPSQPSPSQSPTQSYGQPSHGQPQQYGNQPANPTSPIGGGVQGGQATTTAQLAPKPAAEKPAEQPTSKLAIDLKKFNAMAGDLRATIRRAPTFELRCSQAFDVANDLFGNAPTWVCFYREFLGGSGMIHMIFTDDDEFGRFLRTDQYHQIQQMLTALRSRDLPENDPNDPQRMITVRLPKSLHEAMCDEAGRLNISVNRLCISRMLQLLDPAMIPETKSKPRGRKPRSRKAAAAENQATPTQPTEAPPAQSQPSDAITSYSFRSSGPQS